MQLISRLNAASEEIKVSEREFLLLQEIGLNLVPTATDLVEYISDKYFVSQSGVWYTLKKMKRSGLLDFTEKGEEHRPLGLTSLGMRILRGRGIAMQNRSVHAGIKMAGLGVH